MKSIFYGVISFVVIFTLVAIFNQYQYEYGLLSDISSPELQKAADDWYIVGFIVAATTGGVGFMFTWVFKECLRGLNKVENK